MGSNKDFDFIDYFFQKEGDTYLSLLTKTQQDYEEKCDKLLAASNDELQSNYRVFKSQVLDLQKIFPTLEAPPDSFNFVESVTSVFKDLDIDLKENLDIIGKYNEFMNNSAVHYKGFDINPRTVVELGVQMMATLESLVYPIFMKMTEYMAELAENSQESTKNNSPSAIMDRLHQLVEALTLQLIKIGTSSVVTLGSLPMITQDQLNTDSTRLGAQGRYAKNCIAWVMKAVSPVLLYYFLQRPSKPKKSSASVRGKSEPKMTELEIEQDEEYEPETLDKGLRTGEVTPVEVDEEELNPELDQIITLLEDAKDKVEEVKKSKQPSRQESRREQEKARSRQLSRSQSRPKEVRRSFEDKEVDQPRQSNPKKSLNPKKSTPKEMNRDEKDEPKQIDRSKSRSKPKETTRDADVDYVEVQEPKKQTRSDSKPKETKQNYDDEIEAPKRQGRSDSKPKEIKRDYDDEAEYEAPKQQDRPKSKTKEPKRYDEESESEEPKQQDRRKSKPKEPKPNEDEMSEVEEPPKQDRPKSKSKEPKRYEEEEVEEPRQQDRPKSKRNEPNTYDDEKEAEVEERPKTKRKEPKRYNEDEISEAEEPKQQDRRKSKPKEPKPNEDEMSEVEEPPKQDRPKSKRKEPKRYDEDEVSEAEEPKRENRPKSKRKESKPNYKPDEDEMSEAEEPKKQSRPKSNPQEIPRGCVDIEETEYEEPKKQNRPKSMSNEKRNVNDEECIPKQSKTGREMSSKQLTEDEPKREDRPKSKSKKIEHLKCVCVEDDLYEEEIQQEPIRPKSKSKSKKPDEEDMQPRGRSKGRRQIAEEKDENRGGLRSKDRSESKPKNIEHLRCTCVEDNDLYEEEIEQPKQMVDKGHQHLGPDEIEQDQESVPPPRPKSKSKGKKHEMETVDEKPKHHHKKTVDTEEPKRKSREKRKTVQTAEVGTQSDGPEVAELTVEPKKQVHHHHHRPHTRSKSSKKQKRDAQEEEGQPKERAKSRDRSKKRRKEKAHEPAVVDKPAEEHQHQHKKKSNEESKLGPDTEEINPGSGSDFVDYFFQKDGLKYISHLSEIKRKYEERCKEVLKSCDHDVRHLAKHFMAKIHDVRKVKPVTKEVDVREFRFAEEFSAALEGLELHIDDELVMLNKFNEFTRGMVVHWEFCINHKKPIFAENILDIGTQLMGTTMSLTYVIYIKIAEFLGILSKKARFLKDKHPPEKLANVFHSLVEINSIQMAAIGMSCINSIAKLPDCTPESLKIYSNAVAIQAKFAKNSVSWAMKAISPCFLLYFIRCQLNYGEKSKTVNNSGRKSKEGGKITEKPRSKSKDRGKSAERK